MREIQSALYQIAKDEAEGAENEVQKMITFAEWLGVKFKSKSVGRRKSYEDLSEDKGQKADAELLKALNERV